MSNTHCENGTDKISTLESCENSLPTVVKECISQIIEEEEFTQYNIDVRDISTNGANFLSTLQEIDLKGKSTNEDKELNLFIKNRLNADDFKMFPFVEVFAREAFYYNEVTKIYDKFQDKADIPNDERFIMTKSYGKSNSDVTILDNLTKRGYFSYDRLDAVTFEYAAMAIKQLASFHALSFVLKDKMPDYFEESIKPLRTFYKLSPTWVNYIQTMFNTAVLTLEGETKRKMENLLPQLIDSFSKFIDNSRNDANCLCHGDLKPNNTMLLEKNGKMKDLVIVDFQLMYCGNSASDFVYFVFIGSDQKFRKAHLNELKNIYYERFSRFLKYFGIYADDVYSRKSFDGDFLEYLNFGLVSCLMLTPFMYGDTDEITDLSLVESKEFKFNWNPIAKQRWREIAEDYIEWKKL